MSARKLAECDACHAQAWMKDLLKVPASPSAREQGFVFDLLCLDCYEKHKESEMAGDDTDVQGRLQSLEKKLDKVFNLMDELMRDQTEIERAQNKIEKRLGKLEKPKLLPPAEESIE